MKCGSLIIATFLKQKDTVYCINQANGIVAFVLHCKIQSTTIKSFNSKNQETLEESNGNKIDVWTIQETKAIASKYLVIYYGVQNVKQEVAVPLKTKYQNCRNATTYSYESYSLD